jgi:O-antigen ligase
MLPKFIIYLFSFLPISLIIGNSILNLNIFLIDLILVIYCWKTNYWIWLKDNIFKILIIIYLYLIINSIYNYTLNQNYGFDGILRSLTFIKFIFLAFSLKILITQKSEISRIMLNWMLILIIVLIDVYFEFFIGHNILGFESLDKTRIISFFYDENVVGGFIFTIGFVASTFFFNIDINYKKKLLLNFFLFIIPVSILITGERSNFLKSILLFLVIIYYINSSYLFASKKFLIAILISGILLSISFSQVLYIKQTEFFNRIIKVENPKKILDKFQNIKYFAHYDAALSIFKDKPLNGVGNKNFRKECSHDKHYNENLAFSIQRCTTHPHQIHFELLSEHGLIGYFLFFYFFFLSIRNSYLENFTLKNIHIYTKNFFLIIFLIPLLPSGSLFSTFNGSLFWIIFALANISEKKIQ